MANAGNVFRRTFELHDGHGFGNQFRGHGANDMHA